MDRYNHCYVSIVTHCDCLQLIRMGVRNSNITPRSYHDNFVARYPMYMQAEVVRDGGNRVSFIKKLYEL